MPKFVDPAQKRLEFVAASWDVIATEGLSGVTLRKVAAVAGCTTGSLTHYFSDRSALLIEALREAHFAAAARMITVLGSKNDPFERIRLVLQQALPLDETRLREWKVWIAFWAALAGEPELAAENVRRYHEWREMIEELLSPLIEDPHELAEQANILIALIDGLGLRLALSFGTAEQAFVQDTAAVQSCGEQLDRYLYRHFPIQTKMKDA